MGQVVHPTNFFHGVQNALLFYVSTISCGAKQDLNNILENHAKRLFEDDEFAVRPGV